MTNMMRIRAQLSGPPVTGPAVSTFYCDANASGGPAAVWAFYDAIKDIFPSSLSVQVDATGDILDSADGSLEGTWTESSGAVISGTASNFWVAGVGLRVKWATGGIAFGRRVRGSTFLVPLAYTLFEGGNGTISNAVIADVTDDASDLVNADVGFGIWSRNHPDSSDGEFNLVNGVTVPDKVSWLRSRRV